MQNCTPTFHLHEKDWPYIAIPTLKTDLHKLRLSLPFPTCNISFSVRRHYDFDITDHYLEVSKYNL